MRAIHPVAHPIEADVTLPGSKSYTNRALILAALAEGTSTLSHALFSDDTYYMAESLRRLGISVKEDPHAQQFVVEGQNGCVPARQANLFVGNSGTCARFLTALTALGHGEYVIDGVERMRQRPIQPLLDAINQLGGNARARFGNGCPPVLVQASGLRGGTAAMPGNESSQYFSALLMAAPYMAEGLDLWVKGELVHGQYILMTLGSMVDFGVHGHAEDLRRFTVKPGQHYRACAYQVEPDASAASYFFAAAAITGGRVRVLNLGAHSAQGDLAFVDVLARMGCQVTKAATWVEVRGPHQLRGVDVDMGALSDTFMTLAAIAPFAEGPTTIRGVAHTQRQETDRIRATRRALEALGVRVQVLPDGLCIVPGPVKGGIIDPEDDHRIAMSFALVGLRVPGVSIADPACVAKTFPDYFVRLEALTSPTRAGA